MGIFSRESKNINSVEFEDLSKKISSLSAAVAELTSKINVYESNVNSLRGLVNRKLSGVKEEVATDQPNAQTETIKTTTYY